MKLWPTKIDSNEVEQNVWIALFVILIIYFISVVIALMQPGPTWKDLQVFTWMKSNAVYGLSFTKGYNISLQSAPIYTEVLFDEQHKVYVGMPPIFMIIGSVIYSFLGGHYITARLVHVLFDILMFYSVFIFALRLFKPEIIVYVLFFTISPMILIYATHQDANTAQIGLSVLCYLCFINFLESKNMKWLIATSILFFIGFWTTYLMFSILPGMLLQLWYTKKFDFLLKRKGILILILIGTLSILSIITYLSFLPNGLDWLVYRFQVRLSDNIMPSGNYKGEIDIFKYVIWQLIKLITYFSPICIVLSILGVICLTKDNKRTINDSKKVFENSNLLLQVLFVLFTWGIPFNLMINGAYNHSFSLYYFAPFFSFSSAIGLKYLTVEIKKDSLKKIVSAGILCFFILFSFSRSTLKISGGSLEHVLFYVSPEIPFAKNPNKNVNLNDKVISPDLWKKYTGE